jgi:hypothetical protein
MCATIILIGIFVATVLLVPALARLVGAVVLILLALALVPHSEAAGQWQPTGGWQCGPHVRITTSVDGRDGINFFVTGAWFSNNFTLRRGQLFYNGVPCTVIGDPLGIGARFPKLGSSSREDRCRDILQDREIAETPQQQADYDRCMKQASKPAPRSGEECGGHDTHGNECD